MEKKVFKKRRKRKFIKVKKCRFTVEKIAYISYMDINRLRKYVTERGKVLPRRITGTSSRHQKQLSSAIRKARFMAFMPYVAD